MLKKKFFSGRPKLPLLIWAKAHKFITALILITTFGVGMFGYNKYLDSQNVKDMKQLLSEFEKLEQEVKSKTGKGLYFEASCASFGAFASSYGCSLSLNTNVVDNYNYIDTFHPESNLKTTSSRCRVISGKSAQYLYTYACNISVRNNNRNSAERIFIEYDTTPNSPY